MTTVSFVLLMLLILIFSLQELEPRRQRNEGVELFVDLAATKEDHVEVTTPLRARA